MQLAALYNVLYTLNSLISKLICYYITYIITHTYYYYYSIIHYIIILYRKQNTKHGRNYIIYNTTSRDTTHTDTNRVPSYRASSNYIMCPAAEIYRNQSLYTKAQYSSTYTIWVYNIMCCVRYNVTLVSGITLSSTNVYTCAVVRLCNLAETCVGYRTYA